MRRGCRRRWPLFACPFFALWRFWGLKCFSTLWPPCSFCACCHNEANFGEPFGRGSDCEKRTQFRESLGEVPIVENKPNFGELAGGWHTHRSTIPLFHHSSPMPVVRNKANSAQATRRTSTLWDKSYDELDTQPGSAKQSQFPTPCRSGDRRSRGQACKTKPISRRCRAGWDLGDEGRTCETKPIRREFEL